MCEWLDGQGFLFTSYVRSKQKYQSRFQRKGWPDIYGALPLGPISIPLLIEVKAPGGVISKDQWDIASDARKVGAHYIVAESLDELADAITEMKEEFRLRILNHDWFKE